MQRARRLWPYVTGAAAYDPSTYAQSPSSFNRLITEFLALPDDAPARTVIRSRPERIVHVEFGEAFILLDMDTPQDYADCLAAYRRREGR